jgi:hypothetical protein
VLEPEWGEQSLLAVLFETQYVTVLRAIKYQAKDGMKHVRLTLANASGGTEEFQKLVNMEDKLFRSLQPDVVSYVYAGLLNSDNTIISKPYEAKIERLRHGDPQEIDFLLLQDLDAVTVNLACNGDDALDEDFFAERCEGKQGARPVGSVLTGSRAGENGDVRPPARAVQPDVPPLQS